MGSGFFRKRKALPRESAAAGMSILMKLVARPKAGFDRPRIEERDGMRCGAGGC
jgi:hypothetical protein